MRKALVLVAGAALLALSACGVDVYTYPLQGHIHNSDGNGDVDYTIRKDSLGGGSYEVRVLMTITDHINDDDCFHVEIDASYNSLPVSKKACADGNSSFQTVGDEWDVYYAKSYWPVSMNVELCREKDWFAADNCGNADEWKLH